MRPDFHPSLGLLVACLALTAGCHSVRPTPPPVDLAGLHLPLVPMESLRLVVNGAVGNVPAEVGLALSQPLTTVSKGCFPDGVPAVRHEVRVPKLSGGVTTFREIRLEDARIGGVRLGRLRAGLSEGTHCRVMLGSDVLEPYAVTLDLATRTLSFTHASAERASAPSNDAEEVHRIRLTRDPNENWLLTSARLRQGDATLVGPFAVATLAAGSRISVLAARSSGLRSARVLFRDLHIPERLAAMPKMSHSAILDGVELVPGLFEPSVLLGLDGRWNRTTPFGVLGSDVWGRFDVTFDPSADLLVLRRPKVVGHGESARCGRDGASPSAEACFHLHQTARKSGVWATSTIWRALPRGGRIYLDALGSDGKPRALPCAFGWTFPPSGRGTSLSTPFPWPGLESALPECAQALKNVHEVRFGMWAEGGLRECPARCAFVEDLRSHQASCHCPRKAEGAAAALTPLIDKVRTLLHDGNAEGPEPSDGL